jgi:hypothetical protein
MAKPLQTVTIQAPGFFGLNTEDSPTSLTEQYALDATNCVIDQFGRIGARKGWSYLNQDSTDPIVSIGEYINQAGDSEIVSTTGASIYAGKDSLTDITPSGYSINDGNFAHASFNDYHFLFSSDQAPLYYDGTTCDLISNNAFYSGTVPQGDIVVGGFGRLWVAGTSDNNDKIFFSDLLNGFAWDTGSSGSIDISKVWVAGQDRITALAIHNNFLIIFGERQILIYQGASDPATMSLADTISGIGCIARDSVQSTGADLLFLSDAGIASLNRVVQTESLPILDITRNVRLNFMTDIRSETGSIKTAFSQEEAFYLVRLPNIGVTWCFDVRAPLENGAFRVTKWEGHTGTCFVRDKTGDLIIGVNDGLALYNGYSDNGSSYHMSYFTNYLDFGAPSNLKLLKNLKITVIGGSATDVTLNWGYDYSYAYKKKRFTLSSQVIAEYNIAEYGEGEFNAGVLVNRPTVNAAGGGQVVQLGIEAEVNGAPVSIQRMTAQAIVGRTI